MRKFFLGLTVIIVCLLIFIGFIISTRVGNILPALLPAATLSSSLNNQQAQSSIISSNSPHPYLKVPDGFLITEFTSDTPGARDLEFSPNGTLLVSLRSKGRVVAVTDLNKDGKADRVVDVLTGLHNPHGIAFHDGKLFVAEETQVTRYAWDEEHLSAKLEKKLFDSPAGVTLPGGGGGHQTRSLVFDKKGNLYISLGSTCNVCIEKNPWLASVLITDADGNNPHVFARGLRNAVFLTLNDQTDQIWVTEMGRDLLGDNVPPDEINILTQEGQDFGWPYCYGNKIYDRDFGRESASYCEKTMTPTFELQAHSAPLGLTFIKSDQFPQDWQGDLLVAFHGSWNRSVPTGYKVVRLDVEGNQIKVQTEFITGFIQGNQAAGRPVDVIFDKAGRLFVSDDKAGKIYLVTYHK